jgi:putative glutamine amidotransferase
MRAAVTLNTFGIVTRVEPYEAAMRSVGIEPVRNPESLDGLDGLLLSGGSDINPRNYGQERLRQSDSPDDARDELEMRLLQEALMADLPVLAICRGLQLFNVFYGGLLTQHLPGSDMHRQKSNGAEAGRHPAAHSIQVKPETQLARIIGAGEHQVNSRHHQGVDRLGPGLTVSAVAPDDVVEGLEVPDATFAVAVQWHPEDRIAVSAADRKLFEAFAAAIATWRAEHRAVQQTS